MARGAQAPLANGGRWPRLGLPNRGIALQLQPPAGRHAVVLRLAVRLASPVRVRVHVLRLKEQTGSTSE